jgi:hypothetical protein
MLFAGVAWLVVQQHAVLGHHIWRVRCKQSVDRCVSPCEMWSRAASPSLIASGTVGDALSFCWHTRYWSVLLRQPSMESVLDAEHCPRLLTRGGKDGGLRTYGPDSLDLQRWRHMCVASSDKEKYVLPALSLNGKPWKYCSKLYGCQIVRGEIPESANKCVWLATRPGLSYSWLKRSQWHTRWTFHSYQSSLCRLKQVGSAYQVEHKREGVNFIFAPGCPH